MKWPLNAPWAEAGEADAQAPACFALRQLERNLRAWLNGPHRFPLSVINRAALEGLATDLQRKADDLDVDRPLLVIVLMGGTGVGKSTLLNALAGEAALAQTLRKLQPISLVALLATLVLLFGFQGEQIVKQPLIIALLAIPIVIQVYLNAGIAYALNRALSVPHNVACPSALIGASNFFELAVAAAIALFVFQSGAGLATVVGVLVEVPVMLSVEIGRAHV